MSSVAVIMTVYMNDNAFYLVEAIESMIQQTHQCDIYIRVDGEIDDEKTKILNQFNKKSNIFVSCRENNLGLAVTLNELIDFILESRLEYKYIARMDSDDISRPERIKKQIAFFENNDNIDVCGTSCHEFGASFALNEKHLPTQPEKLMDFSLTHCPFIHPTVMFRVSVFTTGIRYPIDTSLTEDMALWFVLLNKNYQFSNLNEILLDYRLNENTIKRRSGINKAISEFKIRFSNMISLKKISVKNCILIFARLIFHILPPFLIKLAYRKAR
jgi:glycosyltransferase involved in cell wall biosynthesis